jgi:hypothetical protein
VSLLVMSPAVRLCSTQTSFHIGNPFCKNHQNCNKNKMTSMYVYRVAAFAFQLLHRATTYHKNHNISKLVYVLGLGRDSGETQCCSSPKLLSHNIVLCTLL